MGLLPGWGGTIVKAQAFCWDTETAGGRRFTEPEEEDEGSGAG